MDREKDVPGLFHRLLFLDSAKKKITCGVEIDTHPDHFNRENSVSIIIIMSFSG